MASRLWQWYAYWSELEHIFCRSTPMSLLRRKDRHIQVRQDRRIPSFSDSLIHTSPSPTYFLNRLCCSQALPNHQAPRHRSEQLTSAATFPSMSN